MSERWPGVGVKFLAGARFLRAFGGGCQFDASSTDFNASAIENKIRSTGLCVFKLGSSM